MKITMHDDFDGDITVDLYRRDNEVYAPGGMICSASPWGNSGVPLRMEICICPDGKILFRGWDWANECNPYLHTEQTKDGRDAPTVTPEMKNTVSGIFSGRIRIEGIKVALGASVQDICPVDVEKEEKLLNKKIYLA